MRDRARKRLSLALLITVSGGSVVLLMANQGQLRHGALLGLPLLLACIGGMLRALGLFEPHPEARTLAESAWGALPGERPWFAPRVSVPAACVLLCVLTFALGGTGLPYAICAALLCLLPAALRRHGLLVFVVASALYLPLLGSFGLWDPWETHYGEVSREILSRDDWISLWWAQDRWFWSKPIFIFWVEALLWSGSGIDYLPDTNFEHVEWALRLPTYVVSVAGLLAVYFTMGRLWSRRAGLLSALVLATMPYYAMLTHQAITDLPFVGTMVVAVMLLLLALHEDPQREVQRYRVLRFTVSAQELVLGLFLLLTLPQVLYLFTRNVTFIGGLFAWHGDDFLFGSGHNPDVPGNFGIHEERPRFQNLFVQPMAQALYWGAGVAAVIYLLRRERRAQALYMIAFYIACALSFMAKGIPGFALPGLIALLYLLSCGRFSLLLEGRLRVALGTLVLSCVGMPWFVAMYVRHGAGFTNRLLIHDHLNRLTQGVHGDTGSIEYFIEQLGFGMFPWIALAPLALGSWLFSTNRASAFGSGMGFDARQREAAVVIGLWFASAFTLYSAMITKFHHYILPVVPPAAILIGALLDRLLGPPSPVETQPMAQRAGQYAFTLLAPVPLVLGFAGLRGDVRGILPDGLSSAQQATWALQHPWPFAVCLALIGVGCVSLVAALQLDRKARAAGGEGAAEDGAGDGGGIAAGMIAGAVLCAFVGRDLSWTTAKRPSGQERLIDLFIYNYDRPFPEHFDYRPIFTGFAVVASLLVAATALRTLRPVMTRAFLGLACAFTLFALNVYMIDLTPHWSQRDLVKRYYKERKGKQEPLVAWQMNWKGENLYSGNRVAVFVDLDNKAVNQFIDEHKGTRAFFLLEHGRLNRFKSMVGKRKVYPLTSERDNNKFVLVKVML